MVSVVRTALYSVEWEFGFGIETGRAMRRFVRPWLEYATTDPSTPLKPDCIETVMQFL